MARRDHPLRLPVRDRAPSTSPTSGRSAGLADDLTTGTLDLRSTVGFARRRSAARLDGRGAVAGPGAGTRPDETLARRPGTSRSSPTSRSLMRRGRTAPRSTPTRPRPAGAALHAGSRRRSTASSPGTADVRRRRRRGRRRRRTSTRSGSRSAHPDGAVAETRPTCGRLPARRDPRAATCCVNGAPRLHPRRQPPRLRPAHRAGHLAARRCAPTSS